MRFTQSLKAADPIFNNRGGHVSVDIFIININIMIYIYPSNELYISFVKLGPQKRDPFEMVRNTHNK